MKTLLSAIAVAALAVAIANGPASAANRPTSVVGKWAVIANQSNDITLTIVSQGTAGACKQIEGTMVDPAFGSNDNIEGFYCPTTGRISFLRRTGTTVNTYQVYSGNVSQINSPQYVGGTFSLERSAALGEYEWFGTFKPGV